ncbi:MAG: uracil-DNA glycosylase family protein [archaeon]
MNHRARVLSENNGNLDSKVLFIAEAPGRLGADRTYVPLNGDKTGDNFEKLLSNIGWDRSDIFITNAILCNPRQQNGNNDTPTKDEIINCSAYLQMTINLIHPEVIVTLGRIALESINYLFNLSYQLSESVSSLIELQSFNLFPMYHPAPRALLHRSFSKQTSDYIHLARIVDPIKGMKTKRKIVKKYKRIEVTSIITKLEETIIVILELLDVASLFKITKLLYLIDLYSIERFGYSLTGSTYIRQQDGPWIPILQKILQKHDKTFINYKNINHIQKIKSIDNHKTEYSFKDNELELIAEIVKKYGKLSHSQIKTKVYLTDPMKSILKRERMGENMLNKPVLHE